DPRWWPAGLGADARRTAELASALAGEPDRAATGITWPEARAYAAWRGKRLPTLVEWEFAVRGAQYRERPASATPPGAPRTWPANLCAGAREWTATPERLVAEALDFASQCRRYPQRLCAAEESRAEGGLASASAPRAAAPDLASAHWVAGPGSGGTPDWTARETCA